MNKLYTVQEGRELKDDNEYGRDYANPNKYRWRSKMKSKGLIAFIGFTALIVAGGILFFDYKQNSPQVIYKGDVTFTTEEEYVDFKKYATQPEVIIKEIQVLASEPPIWVRYHIVVPREFEPPPAYDRVVSSLGDKSIVYCGITAVGIVGMIFIGIRAGEVAT